jgi:hypothetical protein
MKRHSTTSFAFVLLSVMGACTTCLAQLEHDAQSVFLFRSPGQMESGQSPDLFLFPDGLSPETSIRELDTIDQGKPRMRLLPDHLSPMESVLWGEGGILRKTGIAPLTPGARKSELGFRRTLLTLHQIGGFITVGLMIPTLILGQRNINNWNAATEGSAPFDRQLDRTHKQWAGITFAAYMTTASFSVFSPPPLIRRDEGTNTITIHKTLAWIHFTGMIATPILGMLASRAHTVSQAKDYRTAHQITAYVTAAALTASMIVVTF